VDVAISPDTCRFPEINSKSYPNTLYEFRITSGRHPSPTTWKSPSQRVRSEAAEAAKRLSKLASKHEWKVRTDPKEPDVFRYAPQRQGKRGSESSGDQQRN
jgi:hypothetical protein